MPLPRRRPQEYLLLFSLAFADFLLWEFFLHPFVFLFCFVFSNIKSRLTNLSPCAIIPQF